MALPQRAACKALGCEGPVAACGARLRARGRAAALPAHAPRRRGRRAAVGAVAAATATPTLSAPPAPPLPPGVSPWSPAQLAAAQRGRGPPVGAYDPEELAAAFRGQPLLVAARVAAIASTLGAVVLSVAFDAATGALPRTQKARAVQLRKALTFLGAPFVKLGQALSTRPDLLPAAFLEELGELQDALPGFPDAEAFALMESELGQPLERVYRAITPRPVAAASLGQVYRAVLADSGAAVAVKVQRPGSAEALRLDFAIIRGGAAALDGRIPGLYTSLVSAVDAFVSKVYQELDYVQEGRNAERFAALYGDSPDVLVPTIHWSATSSRVLTMDWVDGVKLSDAAGIAARGGDVVRLVGVGIRCSLRQLLESGYFHADPHPGNLLGTPDGRLAFIDFGMMSETPSEARYAIIAHVVHLVNRDYEQMAQDYYRLGFLDRSVDVAPIVPALADFFDDVLTATVSDLNFKVRTAALNRMAAACMAADARPGVFPREMPP
jgi:aarF domain-containing kinase